ncbi:MAG TPA: hypothetical protein VMW54_11715 [Terriglobia bacterium]|nr:hypothetical protein [Terriglobia bacterium]
MTKRTGILGMTRGGPDFRIPPSTPGGGAWRYGLALPFQAAHGLAAISCNIRAGFHDFEGGNDVILFSDPADIHSAQTVPLNRNQAERHPRTGQPAIMVKYPAHIGFVPFGAKRADGTPHPGAGIGFGLTEVVAWPVGGEVEFRGPDHYEYLELQQYSYDGKQFRVLRSEHVEVGELLSGWTLYGGPLSNAIPDGDDLLFAMAGGKLDRRGWFENRPAQGVGAGVTRWRRGQEGWRPVSFTPVTGWDRSMEPSLIRDTDGSFLFCARLSGRNAIRVWRSSRGDKTWAKVIEVSGMTGFGPMTLNQALDGTPYVAANLYDVLLHPLARRFRARENSAGVIRGGPAGREKLCIWPLSSDRTYLETPVLVRDAYAEFGPAPSGDTWNIDHPSALTVQLGDHEWHNIMAMRICDHGEVAPIWIHHGYSPAPQSGTYIEEAISAGEPIPVWNF